MHSEYTKPSERLLLEIQQASEIRHTKLTTQPRQPKLNTIQDLLMISAKLKAKSLKTRSRHGTKTKIVRKTFSIFPRKKN